VEAGQLREPRPVLPRGDDPLQLGLKLGLDRTTTLVDRNAAHVLTACEPSSVAATIAASRSGVTVRSPGGIEASGQAAHPPSTRPARRGQLCSGRQVQLHLPPVVAGRGCIQVGETAVMSVAVVVVGQHPEQAAAAGSLRVGFGQEQQPHRRAHQRPRCRPASSTRS
jgi:hypothetical protein